MRQMMSGVPPAACETMIFIGRFGQLCAAAGASGANNKPISVMARTSIDISLSLRENLGFKP
jgi:hypothetical protein